MKIRATGHEFAADFPVHRANLVPMVGAARRDHFRHHRPARMPSFFRDLAANGEPGAFFAAHARFCLREWELADYLKPTASDDRLAVGNLATASIICVVANAARRVHFPFAGFHQ